VKKWKAPFEAEPIDDKKMEKIISNVTAALMFMGIYCKFD
jgi:hypothetical protein